VSWSDNKELSSGVDAKQVETLSKRKKLLYASHSRDMSFNM